MTKLVNLDELAAVERAVKYKGVSYAIKDLSVRDMVVATKAVEQINAAFTTQDFGSLMEHADVVFSLATPDFPKDQLATLNMRQVTALVGLVMDAYPDLDDTSTKPAAAEDAAGNA